MIISIIGAAAHVVAPSGTALTLGARRRPVASRAHPFSTARRTAGRSSRPTIMVNGAVVVTSPTGVTASASIVCVRRSRPSPTGNGEAGAGGR